MHSWPGYGSNFFYKSVPSEYGWLSQLHSVRLPAATAGPVCVQHTYAGHLVLPDGARPNQGLTGALLPQLLPQVLRYCLCGVWDGLDLWQVSWVKGFLL